MTSQKIKTYKYIYLFFISISIIITLLSKSIGFEKLQTIFWHLKNGDRYVFNSVIIPIEKQWRPQEKNQELYVKSIGEGDYRFLMKDLTSEEFGVIFKAVEKKEGRFHISPNAYLAYFVSDKNPETIFVGTYFVQLRLFVNYWGGRKGFPQVVRYLKSLGKLNGISITQEIEEWTK